MRKLQNDDEKFPFFPHTKKLIFTKFIDAIPFNPVNLLFEFVIKMSLFSPFSAAKSDSTFSRDNWHLLSVTVALTVLWQSKCQFHPLIEKWAKLRSRIKLPAVLSAKSNGTSWVHAHEWRQHSLVTRVRRVACPSAAPPPPLPPSIPAATIASCPHSAPRRSYDPGANEFLACVLLIANFARNLHLSHQFGSDAWGGNFSAKRNGF